MSETTIYPITIELRKYDYIVIDVIMCELKVFNKYGTVIRKYYSTMENFWVFGETFIVSTVDKE